MDSFHGINHWQRVYEYAILLAKHYKIDSKLFEYFALLHDSRRLDEAEDCNHGKRAGLFIKNLIRENLIDLCKADQNRLIYACVNHTKVKNSSSKYFQDLAVQICMDADKLDIQRVGIIRDEEYFSTSYAKYLVREKIFI